MSTDRRIRVLSVDDHPILSEGIATMINGQPDMELVASASTGTEGILKHREIHPDITLMDMRLPISVALTSRSRSGRNSDARIILLTMFAGDVDIQRALKAGAQGYLLKNMPPEQMLETIRSVHAGKKRVPPEIASHLAEHMARNRSRRARIDVLQHVSGGNGIATSQRGS